MDASPPPTSLIEAFAEALGRDKLSAEEYAFASQALEDAQPDDLAEELTPADLAAILAGFWSFAERREGEGAQIRLRRAEGEGGRTLALDVLEIVQDDAPFLVDSVLGELGARRVEPKGLVHPVLSIARDAQGRRCAGPGGKRESLILVLLGPVGEDRRDGLLEGVAETLVDVHAAVDDFAAMTALMQRSIEELGQSAAPAQPYGLEEELAFLRWLTADRFVFLGAREYQYPRDADGGYLRDQPSFDHEAGLGVLRDPARSVMRRASEPALLSDDPKAYLSQAPAVMVSKANLHTRVHRRTHMDFIGIRRYGRDGLPAGEVRFVGLFTADAYELPAREIPLVRRKIKRVLARAGRSPSEHDQRRLRHIVETYPRDDLFQIDEDTLLHIAEGVLHLYDRPRVRVFVWRDAFDRFLSILLYTPRERFHADTARQVAAILAEAWDGRVSAVYPRVADEPLVRVHVIISLNPGEHPQPDLRALEAEITGSLQTWSDRLETAIRAGAPGDVGAALIRWGEAFPPGYRDRYDAAEALRDLEAIDALEADGEPIRVRPYRSPGDPETRFRFKLYVRSGPAPLSDVLPIVEHMGLKGLDEAGFPISPGGEPSDPQTWVHDYLLEASGGEPIAFEEVAEAFDAAMVAVWTGRTESDGFNRLVFELGAPWREAALIRALARWRQQTGLDPSQPVQEAALSAHPGVARLILDLFKVKFDPAVQASAEDRRQQAEAVYDEIEGALQHVASLDEDRVLRRLAQTVRAMTRTNYYQLDAGGRHKAYISFKLASREVEALPAPKPFREIFVAGRRVEGVHLRFGPVARGGLRWSDRRDDFRTEVLGLVRTQQVKNAVIVPVGSKGGFYPKCLPRGGAADAVRAEAIEAYKTFLDGVLDLTDNLDAEGRVVRPEGVIAHDPDDPYLVVAADKGTATFSDIANGVADEYGFWLGDAFASGGSHGYDHKAMGITARGAWESAKRHFRQLGKDIQTEPFVVIGVGDMSGDVFGNGMLLSKAIRLVAAFDHRHVFIDPDPDTEKSWAERQRLFALPRSSWDDYDRSLISAGGGVFPRSAKTVQLTPQIKALLGIGADALAPTELIRAVLAAPCELLYFGGIGTYVKAPVESHAQVADKANDAVRLDAGDLKARVIVEGANLGMTQAGRIAFARAGGRINTDAIDNSAGVDTSDHEVNIKILAALAIAAGKLKAKRRDPLLQSMTDEVAAHVLAHNYAQTLALSLAEAEAPAELDAHARFMALLVEAGKLDRPVEGLPGPLALAELRTKGLGLTRPELAVLLAYAKLELSADLVAGAGPDDEGHVEDHLKAYFPKELAPFEAEMRRHRLRREIIATGLANAMVDRCGPTFASRLMAAAPCDAAAAAAAFETARKVFGLEELWARVSALDLKVPAAAQRLLYREVSTQIRAQTFWLATRIAASGEPPLLQGLIDAYSPAVEALRAAGPSLLSSYDQAAVEARAAELTAAGAPEDLARAVASLAALRTAVEIVGLAREASWPPEPAARLFHAVGAAFGFDRLRGAAAALALNDEFERRAVRRLIVDLVDEQTALARAVMAKAKPEDAPEKTVEAWSAPRKVALGRAMRTLAEIETAPDGWSFAKLTLAHSALREVAGA